MDNEALMLDLVSWARGDAHIDPDNFDCRYYSECNKSIGSTLWRGDGCRMSYVGRQYGSTSIDDGFRLVIVGIDHGAKGRWTFEECRDELEHWFQKGGCSFNPHYRGVVKTAAAVFGNSGDYCRTNCTKACQQSRDPEARHCVIDRIAQPNNVKCTPKDTENATSRVTWKMKENCAHHLADELKRLKPNLVVFHGVGARWAVSREFEACGIDMKGVDGIPDQYGPVLYKSKNPDAYILFLNHPSRGWLDRQWDAVVVPALRHLRDQDLIPAQENAIPVHEIGMGLEDPLLSGKIGVVESGSGKPVEASGNATQLGDEPTSAPTPKSGPPDDIKARTRDAIGNFDILDLRDGRLHLKHVTSAFGTIVGDDLERGVLRVIDKRTGEDTTFASVDALIAAGWVID